MILNEVIVNNYLICYRFLIKILLFYKEIQRKHTIWENKWEMTLEGQNIEVYQEMVKNGKWQSNIKKANFI